MSDDFDRKLEELRRGTEPLRAPDDFDAVLTARLVAAAALPPAALGAGLALGVRLGIAAIAFGLAGGGVWVATGGLNATSEPHPQAVIAAGPGVAPGATPAARAAGNTASPLVPPQAGAASERGTSVAANPADVAGGVAATLDGGLASGSAVVVESAVLVSRQQAMACGRTVDRMDLVSHGTAQLALRLVDSETSSKIQAALVHAHLPWPETTVVGRFVVDGGPGVRSGTAGGVHTFAGNWFVVSGRRRDRIEVVVNEYEPVLLAFDALPPGEHYVGDVQLRWAPGLSHEHALKVLVQGVPEGESARVRLFPMACGPRGTWVPSVVAALDEPAGAHDTNFQHLSPTRYRVAAYAPGAAPDWTEQSVYDGPTSSAVLRLPRDEPLRVSYLTGTGEVKKDGRLEWDDVVLSRGWKPTPALEIRFVPGHEVGERCFELPEWWLASDQSVTFQKGRGGELPPIPHPGARCLTLNRQTLFQNLRDGQWVSATFRK